MRNHFHARQPCSLRPRSHESPRSAGKQETLRHPIQYRIGASTAPAPVPVALVEHPDQRPSNDPASSSFTALKSPSEGSDIDDRWHIGHHGRQIIWPCPPSARDSGSSIYTLEWKGIIAQLASGKDWLWTPTIKYPAQIHSLQNRLVEGRTCLHPDPDGMHRQRI
jgi:hypothetical protein